MRWGVVTLWALTPQWQPSSCRGALQPCTDTLAILGSNGSLYSESLDLHAASPLYQCPSLVDLDRYLLVLVYPAIRGYMYPCVCMGGYIYPQGYMYPQGEIDYGEHDRHGFVRSMF